MPDLKPLLDPASVAVIGASADTSGIRGHCCETILRHRFAGRLHFVSRSSADVFGRKTVPAIAELPEAPDLALLLTPAAATPDALRQCIDRGIRAAFVIGSGFADEGTEAGRMLQEELAAIARDGGLALSGPNGEGYVDTTSGLAATFSPVVRAIAPLSRDEGRGGGRVTILAQSGGLGFCLFDHAWSRGLHVDRVITTGNEAALTLADYVDYLAGEGKSDALLIFAEGIREGRRFLDALERCREAQLPVVMVRAGRSAVRQAQAASHTGVLAADDNLVRDLLANAGVVESGEAEEAVEIAGLLAALRGMPMSGKRIGIYSASGGSAGLLADACELAGLSVPELGRETRDVLDAAMPSYASSRNPVDATAGGIRSLGYTRLAEIVAGDPGIDAVVVALSGRSLVLLGKEAEALAALRRTCTKPIVFWTYTCLTQPFLDILDRAGMPTAGRTAAVTKTFEGLHRMQALASLDPATPTTPPDLPEGTLVEHQAYPLLQKVGLDPGAWRLVTNAGQAVAAVREIGRPVAMKIQSPAIPHKTEAGGVRLGVAEEGAAAAYQELVDNALIFAPDVALDGVLIQPMVGPGIEVILGALRDTNFGPVVMIGLGGILAEVMKDTVFAAAPVSRDQALAMIDRLHGRRLFDGVRGASPSNLNALADAVVAVSALALAPGLQELDLNPVFVHAHGLTVADALMVVGPHHP